MTYGSHQWHPGRDPATDPLTVPVPADYTGATRHGSPRRRRRRWPWVVGGVVLTLGAIGSTGEKDAPTGAVTTSAVTPAPTSDVTAPVPPVFPPTSSPAPTTRAAGPVLTPGRVRTTDAPAPRRPPRITTREAPADDTDGGPFTVTPGAYCDHAGAVGETSKGTAMVCTVAKGGRLRWKAA